jgi:hypothetical protein
MPINISKEISHKEIVNNKIISDKQMNFDYNGNVLEINGNIDGNVIDMTLNPQDIRNILSNKNNNISFIDSIKKITKSKNLTNSKSKSKSKKLSKSKSKKLSKSKSKK